MIVKPLKILSFRLMSCCMIVDVHRCGTSPYVLHLLKLYLSDVSVVRIPSTFRIRQCKERNRLMDPEDELTIILRNIGNFTSRHGVTYQKV